MRSLKWINLLVFIIIVIGGAGASSVPEAADTDDLGIYPAADITLLSEKAEEAEFHTRVYDEDGEQKIDAVSDFHAVFELDIDTLSAIIPDHDNGEKIFSRMVDTVVLNPEDDLSVPHRQRVHNSVKFLGIGSDYIYTTRLTVERPSEYEFAMRWVMTDCEEGNFEDYSGFWYLASLPPADDGKPRTYVRLRAETTFCNLVPFQDLIMNMFTGGETVDVFNSLYKAAVNGY